MRTRNRKCSLWLNEKEFNHLEKQAKATGLKKEQFIRSLIMKMDVRARPHEELYLLLRVMNTIGDGVNQIIWKINSEDLASQKELLEIKKLLAEIFRAIKYEY